MNVVVALLGLVLAQQVGDDLGGGVPFIVPSAADLGVVAPEDSSTAPDPETKPGPVVANPLTPAAAPMPALRTEPDDYKAENLYAQLESALLDLSEDHRALGARLETLSATTLQEGMHAAEPRLKPMLRLVRARALLLTGRFDLAGVAIHEAHLAFEVVQRGFEPAPARRMLAALRFQEAAIAEARARAEIFRAGCGGTLGLKGLAAADAKRRRNLLDEVANGYLPISQGPDRLWARRAAFQVAVLYEEVARHWLTAPSYRAVQLPSPYAIELISTSTLLDPLVDSWLGEIRRLYTQLITAIDALEPDHALADRLRERAAALALVPLPPTEALANPWAKDLHSGLLRLAQRIERRNAAGRFVLVESKAALAAMVAEVASAASTIDHAYALVGLAETSPEKVSAADVLAALSSTDERMVVAGLLATEHVVVRKGGAEKAVALLEAVTAAYAAAPAEHKQKPFTSLQASLYSPLERSLLALAAIAKSDRSAAELMIADDRIPIGEKAWLIAELADPRFAVQFDKWAWDHDERVAALAVWGGVVARGKHASYLLRPASEGLIGCVSRAAAP